MSTQHTNNDKTFPLWATLPTKHMPTKATARMNTFFFGCVAPRGISFAGRSPTPPLRSPIAALRGWPARTREYAGLCLPVGGSRGLMMAAPSVHGKHVVERKACGVRSANIRTAPDIVKRNARGLDLQKYAPHRIWFLRF